MVTINDGHIKVVIYATETKSKNEMSMHQNIFYVGLDVDDTQYHGSALDRHTGEVICVHEA